MITSLRQSSAAAYCPRWVGRELCGCGSIFSSSMSASIIMLQLFPDNYETKNAYYYDLQNIFLFLKYQIYMLYSSYHYYMVILYTPLRYLILQIHVTTGADVLPLHIKTCEFLQAVVAVLCARARVTMK